MERSGEGKRRSQMTSDGGAECEERRDELSKTED